jgi:ATP-dependent Clp protease ATP-binding subunit ClpA
VEGLAQLLISGRVPHILKNKHIVSLSIAEIFAGTKYRGEFEARIKRLISDIRARNREIILFIDELHTITQTKGAEGAINLSDILKPALARGDLQVIGATTEKEYKEYIMPDVSWERRFQPVLVDEPTVAETIKIMHGLRRTYEDFHNVTFTDKALEAAVRLSKEYITGRRLPDKAIDIIDEAAALVTIEHDEHKQTVGLLHDAARRTKHTHAEVLPGRPLVGVQHIKEVVAEWSGIKLKNIH